MAGLLRDWSGSYTMPMSLGGSLDVLAGLSLVPLALISSLYYRHKEELANNNTALLSSETQATSLGEESQPALLQNGRCSEMS